MRILFAWHAAVEPEYRKLFKEIVKVGCELIVVCPTSWTEGGRLQRMGKGDGDGYRVLPLPVIFRDRVKGFFYLNFKSLCDVFHKFEPDIVHIFEEPYSLSCGQLVGLCKIFLSRAKIIIESFENMNIYQKFPFSSIEKFVLRNADILIVIPNEGKEIWRTKGFSKIITQVPVGIDENLFKRTEDSLPGFNFLDQKNKVRIAYVGRLAPEKGVFLLLKAFSRLLNDFSFDCELLIVGNGEKENLKILAIELGVIDDVIFMDVIENQLLPLVYSRTDILVLPSMTTSGWKEQFGRVLIEAMACEVAVIGSSCGEIPNIIGNAGMTFKEGDIEALVKVLKELISNKELRVTMGRAGRKRVLENFTWRRVAERLVKVYEEALKQ
jgi:glycosyltransferase involved in cell wall biosynthesis